MLKSILKTGALALLAISFTTNLQAQIDVTAITGGVGGASGLSAFGAAPTMGTGSNASGTGTLTPSNSGPVDMQMANQLQPGAQNAAKAAQDPFAPDAQRQNASKRPPKPSQFQRFVQESTGRLLPIYGHDLFDSPQAYTANNALPAPDDYLLGPGDQIQLQVAGPMDFSTSLVLDRNGQVTLPKIGVVTLAGVAVRDLEKTLSAQLGTVFTNFKASASLGRLRGIQVYVVGQAQQPGTFQLSSLSTLVNALFASGGPSANGSMRAIELKRGGKTLTTLDLYDFIARGDKSHDLPLMSGDVIVIPPVGPRVAVTGAFDQAAIYELKTSATSLQDILALGGGVPALATSKKALLERISRSSNPPRQVQELVLDAQGLQQKLQDGDVLTLLDISPGFANAVTLQGTVADPLRYRWFDGMKISDLIPEREALVTRNYYKRKNLLVQNLKPIESDNNNSNKSINVIATQIGSNLDQINWDYAVIERLDRNTLTPQLIPFNLGKAVLQKDPANNLPLLAGDVVTILSQNDLRVPQERQSRLVRVEGEVAAPGVYQSLPGETLPMLIKRVGGLTPQAYVFGTELNRESVRTRQQQNLDTLVRRLEAQSQSQPSATASNRNGADAAQQMAVIQQQQAQLKGQIERLKSFKSNGRLALELDPRGQTLADLPALPLEDGDRILIPATPGFVSALGSVNNENVFIYKPGKTVGDVIKSAGLTEDAEPSQAFVLRADGSIVAKQDKGGFFGGSFDSLPVMPGDTLVVPAQMDRESRYNAIVRGFRDWTGILANFGLGAAGLKSLGY